MTTALNKLSILDPILANNIKKWTDELNSAVKVHRNNQANIFGDYDSVIDHLSNLKDDFILLHKYLVSKKVTLTENEIKDVMKSIFRSFNYVDASIKDLGYEHKQVEYINTRLQHTLYGDKPCQQH